jgi:NAD(P)-dependent dehydrogenase (short-subunit alcohol dehydrogenase family)
MRFSGRTVLVTGGGMGIGQATALAFAKEGANVVVSDLAVAEGTETADQIVREGGKAIFIKSNVSSPQDAEATVRKAVEEFGRLDITFNNAGISGPKALTADCSIEEWNKTIAIILTGVWLGMKFQILQMLKQGGGSIVNNASILGTVGFATASAYVAAKHGVVGLTKTAAIEYATKGIRVNSVCPGFVVTPLLEKAGVTSNAEVSTMIANLHAMKRMGTVDEIAAAVLWLTSDEASFVTGHAMLVDGGYVIQ